MPREALKPLTVSAFSDEVQEIMARTPHWLLRWGITVIGCIVGALIFISWLIRYPDVIPATISVTGTNPPVQIVARQSGHLQEIMVEPEQEVEAGEILAIIESPTDASRVAAIREQLDLLAPILAGQDEFVDLELSIEGQLGRLQTHYSQFFSEYQNHRSLLGDDYAIRTVALLESQLERKRSQVENVRLQRDATRRELELALLRYERIKALSDRDSVSVSQLQSEEAEFLSQQRASSVIASQLDEEEIAVAALQKEISDLKHRRTEELRESRTRLQESLKRLISEIDLWDSEFVLRTPTMGKVAFYDFWSERQYVSSGSQVFTIDPGSTRIMGRMEVKRSGAGKIETGHQIRIKFDDYPYKEFGMVSGTVRSVSLVARGGAHVVTADIDYPLTTSFKRTLPFKQEMTGEAIIVTRERRLIERIFAELLRAFDNADTPGGSVSPTSAE